MEYAGTKACKLEHFIICDLVEFLCILYNSRICREHAVHIGINLARIGMKGSSQSNRRRVRPPSPKRRVIIIFAYSLESGYNHNFPLLQLMPDSLFVNFRQSRISGNGSCMHRDLKGI